MQLRLDALMNILQTKKFEKHTVVELSLDVDCTLPLGKIDLTARWRAAAESLKELIGIKDQKLVQIDADLVDDIWVKTQIFVFYYCTKGTKNVEEDEQESKEEVGGSVAKSKV